MFKQQPHRRKASTQRIRSDARFAPHRDNAAAALKEDKLSFDEIRVKYHAQPRHLYDLARELGLDMNDRGKRVAAAKRKAKAKDKAKSRNSVCIKIQSTSAADLAERMEMIQRSLSGNGMSLKWLRKPLVCHAQQ